LGVECEEPRIEGAEKNAQSAGCVGLSFGVAPGRDAARSHFRIVTRQVHVRIEFPDFFSGGRIEGENLVVGRSEKKLVVEKDRGGFERRFANQFGLDLRCAGVKSPRDFQLSDIFAGDFRGAGVARAAGVAAVGDPSFTNGTRGSLLLLRCGRSWGGDSQQEKYRENANCMDALFWDAHSLLISFSAPSDN
jgi:hypothetical protein